MSDIEIIQHRVARGVIIEGASGILPADWSALQGRVTAVEYVADTILPYPPQPGGYLTSVTHGLGSPQKAATGTIQPNWTMYTPIWIPHGISAVSMAIYLEGTPSGGQVTLSLYSRSSARLRIFGTVPTTSTGWKIAALGAGATQAVPAGMSWLAVSANNVAGITALMHDPFRFLFMDGSMTHRSTPIQGIAGGPPATMDPTAWVDIVPLLALGVTT